MSTRSIDIHIEHLILQGIDPRQRGRIGEAVRRELERMIAEGGVPASWMQGGAIAAPPVPPVDVRAGQASARIGEQVARTIYRGGKS